ncbi:MAG: O-antigen ligase family protein [Armatimonadetes bacterium]|nr:O-antigen ligase family protein [Armatimonadota bacterium]CUU37331.1 O-Antigen ligase [Armatimonadetes bacterium DC]
MFSAYSTALQSAGRTNWSVGSLGAWLSGMGLTSALSLLFMLGIPSPIFWVTAGSLLIAWGLWAWLYPLPAFACLISVWTTVYQRTTIPLLPGEGGDSLSGISLGDLMWGAYISGWLWRGLHFQRESKNPPAVPFNFITALMVPYLILSMILPILGVLAYGFPPSFAFIVARHLQWLSFALLGYWVIKVYGWKPIFIALVFAYTISVFADWTYSAIQLMVSAGTLTKDYLALDNTFAERFHMGSFFYFRTSGLQTNPNAHGAFGAIALTFFICSFLFRLREVVTLRLTGSLLAALILLTSGSRGAILAFCVNLIILCFIAASHALVHRRHQFLLRLLLSFLGLALALCLVLPLVWATTPHALQRLQLSLSFVLDQGLDENAATRIENWQLALTKLETEFPLGTWVPADYATGISIHNRYISLLAQGLPFYLLAFIMTLCAPLLAGYKMSLHEAPYVGVIGMFAMSSIIFLSVFWLTENYSQPLPLWLLLGISSSGWRLEQRG